MAAVLKTVRRWFRRDDLADAKAAARTAKSISAAEAKNAEGVANANHQWQHNPPW